MMSSTMNHGSNYTEDDDDFLNGPILEDLSLSNVTTGTNRGGNGRASLLASLTGDPIPVQATNISVTADKHELFGNDAADEDLFGTVDSSPDGGDDLFSGMEEPPLPLTPSQQAQAQADPMQHPAVDPMQQQQEHFYPNPPHDPLGLNLMNNHLNANANANMNATMNRNANMNMNMNANAMPTMPDGVDIPRQESAGVNRHDYSHMVPSNANNAQPPQQQQMQRAPPQPNYDQIPRPYQPAGTATTTTTTFPAPAPKNQTYTQITVEDPQMVTEPGALFGIGQTFFWTFLVTALHRPSNEKLITRRRFRHFVALEDRLRRSCPGSILPPRPEKHLGKSLIEEGTTKQSLEFAKARAGELGVYLRDVGGHPQAGSSEVLRLFLTLQDDMGVAWAEVSSSPLTRFTAAGSKAGTGLTEAGLAAGDSCGEEDAMLLQLTAFEGMRMGSVNQAVPKLEGGITLFRERGERELSCAMELGKLGRDVSNDDPDLTRILESLGSTLLRSGRRTKRLGMELDAGIASYVMEYKRLTNERAAFADRRVALQRKNGLRQRADAKSAKLVMEQNRLQAQGKIYELERLELEASQGDEVASVAAKESEEVGRVLTSEVNRLLVVRHEEWLSGMKVLASSFKEAAGERRAIWEAARVQIVGSAVPNA